MQVRGSVGFITGGASGLGEATARMLVGAGGHAVIFDREPEAGAALAQTLGDDALSVAGDVTQTDDIEAALEQAIERFGRLDIAVNCAGISPVHPVLTPDGEPHPLNLFRRAVDVNLIGLFDVVRRSAQLMARNPPGDHDERGVIVNVASIAGLDSPPSQPAYVATKGAVVALTLELARDLAAHGIRVMTIAPGMMDTPMLGSATDEMRRTLVDQVVFPRRLGRPDEFAALVRALIEMTMLNGEVVRLDAATHL